jgi:hypothetical protein
MVEAGRAMGKREDGEDDGLVRSRFGDRADPLLLLLVVLLALEVVTATDKQHRRFRIVFWVRF